MNNYHNKCPEKSIIVKIKTSLSLVVVEVIALLFFFFLFFNVKLSALFFTSHETTIQSSSLLFSIIIYTVYIFKSLSTITSCNSMNCINLLTVNKI